jgi:phosphoribosylamine--glycine ligase
MKVLIVGGGGREDALAWKIARSPDCTELLVAPGNAGTASRGRNLDVRATDLDAVLDLAASQRVDLVVVGPEDPLCAGLVDRLTERGILAFGPTAAAARLEGSKAFAKEMLRRVGVPTAASGAFTDAAAAAAYIDSRPVPQVVKADGLAAGKGVVVCSDAAEARAAVRDMIGDRRFGAAGATVVVEDRLEGEEASYMALCDGERVIPLASSQDHKRALDGDRGPNTGGMGAYSPAPIVTPALERRVLDEILRPLVRGMAEAGTPYRGVLYAGLMIQGDTVNVLEINCRFGDPETQVVVPRLAEDLLPLLAASARGALPDRLLAWDPRAALGVVMASGGYPGPPDTGRVVRGLEDATALSDVVVFHAGTAVGDRGQVVTTGGRVLCVTGFGATFDNARTVAYSATGRISWPNVHYRRDIGHRAPRRPSGIMATVS